MSQVETQEPVAATEPERTHVFKRKYVYGQGLVEMTSKEGAITINLAQVPQALRDAFALQAISQRIANVAGKAFREAKDLTAAIGAAVDELTDIEQGKVEFTETGVSEAKPRFADSFLVGRALFELGKSKVTFGGQTYTWDSADEAGGVLRSLWDVKDKDENLKLTGRQFVERVKSRADVAALLATYKGNTGAKKAAAVDEALG